MAERTGINWTDSTFNTWIGCTKISPGCDHCYAERDMDIRRHRVKWGAGQPRSRTSESYWKQPLRWNAALFYQCTACGYRGPDVLEGECPACHQIDQFTLTRRRVFCASLADVFDNEVDPQWRADLFSLIRATPNLDWLLLTKRVGNVAGMITEVRDTAHVAGNRDLVHWLQCWIDGRPPFNVWLGATVVNQAEADRDIPKLLATPARVRFLSCEPLLGKIQIRKWIGEPIGGSSYRQTGEDFRRCDLTGAPLDGIDWVIAGGESGRQARPSHPGWFRSLREQCAIAGVPFLFKHWGEWGPYVNPDHFTYGGAEKPSHAHAWVDETEGSNGLCWLYDDDGTWTNWTSEPRMASEEEDNENAETLHEDVAVMGRLGKKKAGRALDGREHSEFPRAA
jgi:protein gp37